jgi:D-sedoheptulose 7-phosphate isomerase
MRLLRGRESRSLDRDGNGRDEALSRSISYERGWRLSAPAPLEGRAGAAPEPPTLPLSEAIAGFSRVYAATVLDYLRALPEDCLEPVIRALSGVVADGRTLYVFGNGGSHAIARHLEYALRLRFGGLHGVRVNCGVDYHSAQAYAAVGGYDSIFEAVLRSDQARPGDVAVFISGSGDSDNLLHAAAFCRAQGIQTLSFAGFDGGKISRLRATDAAFVARIPDQQVAEDIIQAILHVAVDLAYERCVGTAGSVREAVSRYALGLGASLDRLEPAWIERVSAGVCEAFLAGRTVFLLAPEGAPLSVSAEHTAHNFNWDAVYQIPNPPLRRICSTPTSCDYTGIGNDRLIRGIVALQQVSAAMPGDVLLLFARDLTSEIVERVVAAAQSVPMTIYALAGRDGSERSRGIDAVSLESDDPGVLGDVGQMCGHMLGRVIHMRLAQAVDPGSVIDNGETYLIDHDLAQRRLLDVVAGL